MRLLRVHIIAAPTCGGLLDGLDLWLRSPAGKYDTFDPLCLIGPNGAGKSQFLQAVAEIFQSAFHAVVGSEERVEGNPELQFELEYLIRPVNARENVHVRISRIAQGKKKPQIVIQRKGDDEWVDCDLASSQTLEILPHKIVGYTSGDNETLSLPFLLSRSGYATEVGERALKTDETKGDQSIPDTRLMLIDYGTHLEVLVANLLLATTKQSEALLKDARVEGLHSFRCVVQLAHRTAPKAPGRSKATSRKGIQLTEELEGYLDHLQRCATCYDYDSKTETYIFDFFVDHQTIKAFRLFWKNALNLYSSLHKLAMLNDLALPKASRERFKKDAKARRFATRLPEPQDEEKVFRFERVTFRAQGGTNMVDYVSLSDGEHQLAQILGVFCMVSFPDVLFLLDEPESHFNPKWRVKFISKLRELPTSYGFRREKSKVSLQDCLLTTHAPFVPSDMARDRVFIFRKDSETGKVSVRLPEIETYGTTFDAILEECFGVKPPISEVSRIEIETLMQSDNPDEIKQGMQRLGYSVEKVFLADRLRQLTKNKGA